jgi:hypothetical protein
VFNRSRKRAKICLQIVQERSSSLLPSLHGLFGHLDQSSLGIAVGEVTDGGHGLVGVVLGQGTGLLDTIAVVDKLTSL